MCGSPLAARSHSRFVLDDRRHVRSARCGLIVRIGGLAALSAVNPPIAVILKVWDERDWRKERRDERDWRMAHGWAGRGWWRAAGRLAAGRGAAGGAAGRRAARGRARLAARGFAAR